MAAWFKSRRMLGIDLGPHQMRLVQVAIDGRAPLVERIAVVDVRDADSAGQCAALLRQALRDGGFTAIDAAVCLPAGAGFVQHAEAEPAGPDDNPSPTEAFLRAQYAATAEGRTVRIAAQASRADVSRAADIARQAGLQVRGVHLRQFAAAVALGMLTSRDEPAAEAGLLVEPDQIVLALAQGEALLACSTARRRDGNNGAPALGEQAAQLLRLIELNVPGAAPRRLRVIADPADVPAVSAMAEPAAATRQLVRPGSSAGLRPGEDAAQAWSDQSATFAAAAGAALAQMELAGRSVNLLAAMDEPDGRRWPFGRRAALLAAAVGLALLAGVLGWRVHVSGRRLADLERRYEQAQPLLARQAEIRRSREALEAWLPPDDGTRARYAPLLREISRLFPLQEGYVTQLTLEPAGAGTPGGAVNGEGGRAMTITLEGRVSGVPALSAYRDALERSGLFAQVMLGSTIDDDQNPQFPKRYSVRMVLLERG